MRPVNQLSGRDRDHDLIEKCKALVDSSLADQCQALISECAQLQLMVLEFAGDAECDLSPRGQNSGVVNIATHRGEGEITTLDTRPDVLKEPPPPPVPAPRRPPVAEELPQANEARSDPNCGPLVALLDVRSVSAFPRDANAIKRTQHEFRARKQLEDDARRRWVGLKQLDANRACGCPIAAADRSARFV